MNQDSNIITENKRNIWVRGLYMLLMALAYQISGTLMFIAAIFQFLMTLITGKHNTQLLSFGSSLGRYFQQIVNFLTFSSEEVPFPFNDWPSSD
ncbi:DUF4389 domain-containing protein [Candidatus Nitrotoga sp. M5]|uniref:DUF4389 domain-containing protein n=1 Tax=Candidatus Nitrotoga sp. M5 TaxID=2890409 RepID=UPI001EF37C8D|nr:DUF4389 domain-containing protein [Candidatus Nitrotoga sp. M5]CAH1385382.1 conserved hypothetical protein [Candidatus Nitrotoga sp. M5]